MTTWIIESNNNMFRLDGVLADRQHVYWQQKHNKFSVGDIVYFYCAAPDMRIKYKAAVTQIDLTEDQIEDDSEYWVNRAAYYNCNSSWMRIELISVSKDGSLTFRSLKEHGLTASLQGPVKNLPEQLIRYIESRFRQTECTYPDSEGMDRSIVEGAVKRIAVNAYERNPVARQKCIDHYGCRCIVCGFDFGKIYGEFASDFIHVHHIKPIHEIGKEYVIDPIRDLIPVCPNCHAMLHRKSKNGRCYSPEELKAIVEANRQ